MYYPLITDLYNNISYRYPSSQIWVTGHSLGGALASLIAYTFGVPAVTFEAPAERMAAKRLHLPMPPGSQRRRDGDGQREPSGEGADAGLPAVPVTHVFHNGDPIAMGTCTGASSLCGSAGYAMESTCHAGQVVLYNTTGLLGWRENIATHRIATLVEDLLTEDWGERVRREWRLNHSKGKAKGKSSTAVRSGAGNKFLAGQRRWTPSWPWPGGGSGGGGDGSGDGSGDGDGDGDEKDPDEGMPEWMVHLGETPEVSDQNECVDCGGWRFVDEDKWK